MNIDPQSIRIDEFDYELPSEQIAFSPLDKRDQSRLLIFKDGLIKDSHFYYLATEIPPASTMILNDTRVIEARIFFTKTTGGVIEIFCLEPDEFKDPQLAMVQKHKVLWQCMIGGASKWKPGQVLQKQIDLAGQSVILEARYLTKKDDAFVIEFSWNSDETFAEVLHAAGAIPLPPYIKRKAGTEDSERYQTIFAEQLGSVAAPTAALHFTDEVFTALGNKGIQKHFVTLHVGAGTFKPVKSETIADHQMHAESFSVSVNTLKALLAAKQIIAVGTTSLRTLESIHWLGVKIMTEKTGSGLYLDQWEAYQLDQEISYEQSLSALLDHCHTSGLAELFCRTSLIIVPGYRFRSARAIITNFHQPRSTLLLLVAAFIGKDWEKVYTHALEQKYRFLSYGDSSLLWRKD